MPSLPDLRQIPSDGSYIECIGLDDAILPHGAMLGLQGLVFRLQLLKGRTKNRPIPFENALTPVLSQRMQCVSMARHPNSEVVQARLVGAEVTKTDAGIGIHRAIS